MEDVVKRSMVFFSWLPHLQTIFFSPHSSLFSTFDPYMIIVYVTNARAHTHTHAQIVDRKKTLSVEIPI